MDLSWKVYVVLALLYLKFRKGQGQVSLAFYLMQAETEKNWYAAWQTDLTLSCELFFAVWTHYLGDSRVATVSAVAVNLVLYLSWIAFSCFETSCLYLFNNCKDRRALHFTLKWVLVIRSHTQPMDGCVSLCLNAAHVRLYHHESDSCHNGFLYLCWKSLWAFASLKLKHL